MFLIYLAIKPECTISISDDDLLSIMNGKLTMMTVILFTLHLHIKMKGFGY